MMNPELRFDRLERVLKLAIRAGYRERLAWREQSREQTEKINAMISTHLDAMDRLDKQAVASRSEFDEWMGKLAASEVKFERRMNRLAAAQEEFDDRLTASREEFNDQLTASREEFNDQLTASREEFNERMNRLAASLDGFDARWVANEARFEKQMATSRAEFEARMDKLIIAQNNSDKKIEKLAEEHAATERSLKAFLDGLQKGQNGNPPV